MQSVLLYNPVAGRRRKQRLELVRHVASILQRRGFAVETEATRASGSAQQQSRGAVQRGAYAVFACGGDGTVHDVLQGIAGSDVLLGVVPSGSANALARELRISPDPCEPQPSSLRSSFFLSQPPWWSDPGCRGSTRFAWLGQGRTGC